MGRLRKDHSGYRTSGIWLKYKQPSVDEGEMKPRSKKDKRKWCKGKVGVKHNYLLLEKYEGSIFSWTIYRCSNCGRKKY